MARILTIASVALLSLTVLCYGPWANADDRQGWHGRHGRAPGHAKPIIVVPNDFQGTVEVYMTPHGYQIRTRRDNDSPYPEIEKSIRSNPLPNGASPPGGKNGNAQSAGPARQ